jgi:hypothetical protein
VLLEDHDVAPAVPREVVGDARAADATSADDAAGGLVQVVPGMGHA